jgi:hypothetical protein
MDFWFRQRFLSFTDEFTRRFLDMASFCDMQAPQTAFTLLLRRFRGGNFSAPPQGATALLAEKAAWWNQIIEDTNQCQQQQGRQEINQVVTQTKEAE